MIQAMNNLNLLKKKWDVIDSQTAKDNTTKTVLSNLQQKVLNQVFVIILMHLF